MTTTTSNIVVIVLVALACITDLRTRRIPNALTFPAAIGALLFHGFAAGIGGVGVSAAGWSLGAALFFPIFALRGMGAGDVKLLAAVGAWLGPVAVLSVALITAVAGGIAGIAVALGHGYLGTALTNVWGLMVSWSIVGIRPLPALTLEGARGPRLAYALPIAIGKVTTLWLT